MSAITGIATPDETSFRRDLVSTAFLIGETEGRWRLVSTPKIEFPYAVFAVSAESRMNGPDEFHFRVNMEGYPGRAPNTCLWDSENGAALSVSQFPKGNGDVAIVFRTDWPPEAPGSCLYHPMDRRPLSDHPNWPKIYASQTWNSRCTIVDLLEVIYVFLNSASYTGIC